MNDEQFGTLKWGGDAWETTLVIDYFRGAGANLDAIDAAWRARQKEAAKNAPPEDDTFRRSLPLPTRILFSMGRWLFRRWWHSDDGPGEEETLFRDGKFKLSFAGKRSDEDEDDETNRPKPPSPKQRAAWNAIVARGDSAWAELMALMTAEYQHQRPTRMRWWRAIYGEFLLDEALPDVRDAAGMKKLVRPIEFRVKRVKKDAASADVAVWFTCTWNTDGVVVLLRDGRAVEVGAIDLLVPMKKRPEPALDHPVFGPLRRIPDDDPWEVVAKMNPLQPQQAAAAVKARVPYPWEGTMRCEPLRDYFLAADDRAKFKFDPAHADAPQSAMPWDFAQGNFDLRVYAQRGQEPSDAQAEAFTTFKADDARHAATLVAAVFDHYTANSEKHRSLWSDENLHSAVSKLGFVPGSGLAPAERKPGYIDEVIPKLDSAAGLHDRMWLKHVHVHPADDGGGGEGVTIAFQFVCTWIGDGFTVHWRGGRVEKIGRWKTAEPSFPSKRGAAS